jgi:hypothetical protein
VAENVVAVEPVKITDGIDIVSVTGANQFLTSTGLESAFTTLSAVSAVSNGTTVDFASAKANITLAIVPSAGVAGGVVVLQCSQDSTSWVKVGADSAALAASTNQQISVTGAWRYARAAVTTIVSGGTVTAKLMAA